MTNEKIFGILIAVVSFTLLAIGMALGAPYPPWQAAPVASPIVAIGDSLACGLFAAGADGGPEVCKVGASTAAVLEIVKAVPCDELAGRAVVLSTGATNSGTTHDVAEQILAARLCKPSVLGLLGTDPALGLNTKLGDLCKLFTVTCIWWSDVDPDNPHHPKSYKALYGAAIRALGAQQTAAGARYTPPTQPTAAGLGPKTGGSSVNSPLNSSVSKVPAAAVPYQRTVIREGRLTMGLNAPIAMFAAQLQTESNWRPGVCSGANACGLAQFIPSTAKAESEKYADLASDQPYNPDWSIRALTRYDHDIYAGRYVLAVPPATDCDRWAFSLSGYNGGEGWISRDRALAQAHGKDPHRWWGNVELYSSRSASNTAQNRAYPRLILLQRQAIYAVWGGVVTCSS